MYEEIEIELNLIDLGKNFMKKIIANYDAIVIIIINNKTLSIINIKIQKINLFSSKNNL